MYKLLILALVMVCCGCARERAQVASDARAGVHAAEAAIQAKAAAEQVLAILDGVDKRLPAVAEVPSVEFPAPAMTPEAIQADPVHYSQTAPPEPRRWGGKALAAVSVLGMLGLYGLKILAPMIPGGGNVVGGIADLAYTVLSHKAQRQADQARDIVHDNAPLLQSVLSEAKGIPNIGAKIPPQLESAVALLVKSP